MTINPLPDYILYISFGRGVQVPALRANTGPGFRYALGDLVRDIIAAQSICARHAWRGSTLYRHNNRAPGKSAFAKILLNYTHLENVV